MGKLLFTTSDTDQLRGQGRKDGDDMKFCITEKALWLILLIIIALCFIK